MNDIPLLDWLEGFMKKFRPDIVEENIVDSKITNVSDKLLLFLEEFESFESKPYICPGGVPTIGFGTTFYFDTKKFVTMQDMPITIQEARRLKQGHLDSVFCPLADKLCRDDLKQNEFDAVVSFLYNAGATYKTNSGELRYYNLFKHINDYMPSEQLMDYWRNLAVTGNGIRLNGLIRRRKRESLIFVNNEY